jgi:hypothetical protein
MVLLGSRGARAPPAPLVDSPLLVAKAQLLASSPLHKENGEMFDDVRACLVVRMNNILRWKLWKKMCIGTHMLWEKTWLCVRAYLVVRMNSLLRWKAVEKCVLKHACCERKCDSWHDDESCIRWKAERKVVKSLINHRLQCVRLLLMWPIAHRRSNVTSSCVSTTHKRHASFALENANLASKSLTPAWYFTLGVPASSREDRRWWSNRSMSSSGRFVRSYVITSRVPTTCKTRVRYVPGFF